MQNDEIRIIDGREYLFVDIVDLNQKQFKEFISTDIMNPDIQYTDMAGNWIQDVEIYTALRIKYAFDEAELRGEIILYEKDGGITQQESRESSNIFRLMEMYAEEMGGELCGSMEDAIEASNPFTVLVGDKETPIVEYKDKGSKTWNILSPEFQSFITRFSKNKFHEDVEKFSNNFVGRFAPLLQKRGILDPETDVTNKLKYKTKTDAEQDKPGVYNYNPNLTTPIIRSRVDGYCKDNGDIFLKSLSKSLRAHEMVHRFAGAFGESGVTLGERIMMGSKDTRNGFITVSPSALSKQPLSNILNPITVPIFVFDHFIGGGTAKDFMLPTTHGRGFNEGATNLLSEVFLQGGFQPMDESPLKDSYGPETFLAREIMHLVGEDLFVESMLLDPKILQEKMAEMTGDTHSYLRMVTSLDKFHSIDQGLNPIMNKLRQIKSVDQKKRHEASMHYSDAFSHVLNMYNKQIESAPDEQSQTQAKQELIDMLARCDKEKGIFPDEAIKLIIAEKQKHNVQTEKEI
ncbi:MAG: hypothetical protein FWE16_04155 [Firmicutes bacterium]|nr:hypothetical protein [Bacillota bacterium]